MFSTFDLIWKRIRATTFGEYLGLKISESETFDLKTIFFILFFLENVIKFIAPSFTFYPLSNNYNLLVSTFLFLKFS